MRCLLLLSFIFAALATYAQADHWETLIKAEEQWHYFLGTLTPAATEPAPDWRTLAFDESGWLAGPGGFGYGDNDDATVIPPVMSVFLRKKFTIVDKTKIESGVLSVDYDDGFIAYLNGTEIARANITGEYPPYTQNAITYIDPEPTIPVSFIVSKEVLQSLLTTGENVLAVQVHNDAITSSDLSSNVYLSVGINDASFTYQSTPGWFVPPLDFVSSNLPIVVINTNGQTIPDDPKLTAQMGVIYNGPGQRNNLSDGFNHYNGFIGIETRGESSQTFPKKSYAFETRTAAGDNLNVELLGFPAENDWILYAPYTDKSMVRNDITFKLARDMGRYASRTRACEVVLNGDYQGVYMLMEKIKRDKNRVDIATLNPDEISGDDLTGGYILRIDKWDNNDYPSWWVGSIEFQYFDPSGDELVVQQRNYIRNFIAQVHTSVTSSQFTNPQTGYRKYIDVDACVDFMLMNELAKNVDGFRFSTYMYKDKDSKGGKLIMGPLWDFNLAYGNVNYNSAVEQPEGGWLYNDDRVLWFQKFTLDPFFRDSMYTRWVSLRKNVLSNERITYLIDSMAASMEEAQVRNYQRWPILGQYIWPNQYVGISYASEVAWLKSWIVGRANWMDANMPGELITSNEDVVSRKINIYPNPGNDFFVIESDVPFGSNARVQITDLMGREVFTGALSENKFTWNGRTSSGQAVTRGVYIITIKTNDSKAFVSKIIKE